MVNAHKQTQQLAEVPSSWAHPVERYACQNGHLPRSMMKDYVYFGNFVGTADPPKNGRNSATQQLWPSEGASSKDPTAVEPAHQQDWFLWFCMGAIPWNSPLISKNHIFDTLGLRHNSQHLVCFRWWEVVCCSPSWPSLAFGLLLLWSRSLGYYSRPTQPYCGAHSKQWRTSWWTTILSHMIFLFLHTHNI